MNGDGQITGVDSTIVARHVAGFRGAALTAGLSLGGASRGTADNVLAFINAGCPAAIGARTPLYEALPYVTERVALLAQMNAQGTRGFQYISALLVGTEYVNLYVKDQNTNFSYSAQDAVSTASDLLVQLNGMGARGFRFDSPLTSGNYYARDNTASLTYSYELPTAPTTTVGFLAQANGRGANGFFFVFTYNIGGSTVAIYGKDTSDARYQYELHPSTDVNVSADDFVAQANAQEVTSSAVDVVPLTAAASTTRRISVSGVWPNGCPPVGAFIERETTTAPRTLVIRLNEILTLVACTQVLTPFRFELDYAPKMPGVLHINLLQASGRVTATGMLGVADASGVGANLSGTWFDTPAIGSILMMTHSVAQPTALVGSWNLFARDGQPRWNLFHSSRRTTTPYVYEADFFEYQSALNPACATSACPMPGFTGKSIGMLRVIALTNKELIVEHWLNGNEFLGGMLAQRSAMTRVEF